MPRLARKANATPYNVIADRSGGTCSTHPAAPRPLKRVGPSEESSLHLPTPVGRRNLCPVPLNKGKHRQVARGARALTFRRQKYHRRVSLAASAPQRGNR